MIGVLRKQFSLSQLYLVHERPSVFVVSQWQRAPTRPNYAYLIYRWLLALVFLVIFILSWVDLNHPDADAAYTAKWLIYLTNWGYTLCTVQVLVAAFMVSTYLLPKVERHALKCYKFYWVTNTIATDFALCITIIYWSLIYNKKTMVFDFMNFMVHGSNSILMLIDLFVVSHPLRILHCFYPIALGLIYAIFTIIFYLAGGISREGNHYIYNIVDWEKPGFTTLIIIGVMGFLVVIHIACWSLHKLRQWMFQRIVKTDQEDFTKKEPAYYDNNAMASELV